MKNKDLKKVYNSVFKDGENNFFTFPSDGIYNQVLSLDIYRDKKVLDVGCGSGEVAMRIAESGAVSVLGIDYSDEAIKLATKNNTSNIVDFKVSSYEDIDEKFDVITLVGVLEHIENPFQVVERLHSLLAPDGKLVFVCPSFFNIRGYVWMTLQLLFDVPMSLTDINFLSPSDFQEYSTKLKMELDWKTFDFSRGNGERMIIDLEKRLVNALRDAQLDNSKVPKLIEWLRESSKFDNDLVHSGAMGLYVLSK